MLPNEWMALSLQEVSTIIDCKHRTPEYVEFGVPVISPGSIKWQGCSVLENSVKLSR